MRTKTLILTAALGTAFMASSMAQVYSVNAVGYVNLEVPVGFSMIANPLDAGEGNNTVGVLLDAAPVGTTVYKFEGGTYNINNKLPVWQQPDMSLMPGEGVFIQNKTAEPFTITFVGEVMQGTLNNDIPEGFSIQSSMVPQAGELDADLGWPSEAGDTIYVFDNAVNNYIISTRLGPVWSPAAPVVGVAESFFVKVNAAKTWTRDFSVNQ
jgi:hypothetical protein